MNQKHAPYQTPWNLIALSTAVAANKTEEKKKSAAKTPRPAFSPVCGKATGD